MHLANENHLPTPISNGSSTLGDLLDEGSGREKSYVVQIGHNMGNRTFLMSVPIKEFRDISVVANERSESGEAVAQRPLDKAHARKLAKYVLKGLVAAAIMKRDIGGEPKSPGLAALETALGKQPYLALQPIVCNLRNVDPGGKKIRGDRLVDKVSGETAGFKIFLSQESILYVVDGQHRRKGIELALEFISQAIADQKIGKTGNLLHPAISGELDSEIVQALYELQDVGSGFCSVQVECHLGLGIPEERQLFHDLNNLSKKISSSMALDFDSSNPVNNFIKEVLIDDDEIFTWGVIEKDISDWQDDKGDIVRKDLVGINARLILNKTNISGATPAMLEPRREVAQRFWETVVRIPDLGQPGAKMKTVAAQPVVLKAIAKLVYDFAFGKFADKEILEKIWQGILSMDYSHNNPMWRYYLLSDDERKSLQGLSEYLPTDDEGFNRDIGGYDSVANTFRFGAKQNDIVPILGDMMRWSWGLPSRQKQVTRNHRGR